MPIDGAGVGESVVVVGLTRLTELYLHSVAEFAPSQVRIVGLLVRSPHQAGRLIRYWVRPTRWPTRCANWKSMA